MSLRKNLFNSIMNYCTGFLFKLNKKHVNLIRFFDETNFKRSASS